jgi:putative oxidoreductase
MKPIYILGRAVFGGFFLYNGINHLLHPEGLEDYVAAKQVAYPHLAVKGSGAALTLAGLSLLLGIKPHLGALGVVGFLAAASPKMHDFWSQEDPAQRQNEMIHFSKNMALLGAAAALAAASPRTAD